MKERRRRVPDDFLLVELAPVDVGATSLGDEGGKRGHTRPAQLIT